MKFRIVILAILILCLGGSRAWAKKNPAHPFFLRTVVTLNGAEVPQGLYDLSVESEGSAARVSLWKEGQFVATAKGAWVKSGIKYAEDEALLLVNSDGSRSLIEIRLAGATKSIVIERVAPAIRVTAKK